MKPRDRVLKALNGEKVDRPPAFMTLTPETAMKMSKHLNLPYEEPLDSMLSTRIS
jgi:uroporphyrinogen-III decarboxylase